MLAQRIDSVTGSAGRAVISNGDFNGYWRFHLAREHQRLYPGTAQGRHPLRA